MKTHATLFALLVSAFACPAFAQPSFDPSGDSLLNGAYYMRQVIYFSTQGTITATINIQGIITFSGAGSYSFNGSVLNISSATTPQVLTTSGNYVISGSGEGYINAPDHLFTSDAVIGMVSNGIFIGSSEGPNNGYSDLMIAAPIGSAATNSTLSGTYSVSYIDPAFLPSATGRQGGGAFFNMTADGQGNLGNINVTSYLGSSATATTENLSGVTYSFSNGAAQVKFGGTAGASNLITGTHLLYISPDGNFIFGGSYDGYDMFVGVRAATSAPSNYAALYYQAGLNFDESAVSSNYSLLSSYFGSFQAFSGNIIGHQTFSNTSPMPYRNLSSLLVYGGSNDFTYYDTYTLNNDGTSEDGAFSQHYVSSANGTIRIGYGVGPYLALNVALQAPAFSGSGVYLSPDGAVNAASSAPFSAQVSPGEFLTLYGSGLADTTEGAVVPYPNMLGGVQVMINQVAAPISYVSPTQIEVIVPFGLGGVTAVPIQVINNNQTSNLVTLPVGSTSAGVFTNNPVGGIGYAAALHTNYSLVSTSSPAQIGETIALYLTGMGAVSPSLTSGTAAPVNPLSYTTASPLVYLLDPAGNYEQAKVSFSGLAPGYAGLYQINLTIPSGLVSGNASLEVIGPDSDSFEALLPINAP
ncbi:MAG TPA: IPT/TIG domain-containing protein [Bryobacteraceae bacterium]|nr:IPT/TIG domain-containing protein [Bryobacteraceae bacterium]